MWFSIALVGNFETDIDEWNTERRRCVLCGEDDNETYRSLKFTKMERRIEELLNKWPNMTVEATHWWQSHIPKNVSYPCIKLYM
jgi:hypothetical protein